MDRRGFIKGCLGAVVLGAAGGRILPAAADLSLKERYWKTCMAAGVPEAEIGKVWVCEVRHAWLLGNVNTRPKLREFITWMPTRFEDIKKGDRFRVLGSKGYETHGKDKPVEWVAEGNPVPPRPGRGFEDGMIPVTEVKA